MYVNGGSVIAIGIIFPVLGTLAVTARFFARHKNRVGVKTDDWLCIPALAIVIITGALLIWGSALKVLGYHSPEYPSLQAALTEPDSRHATLDKFEYAICVLNPLGTGLIRLSFLFFYRRIFRGRVFDIVSWTMIGMVTAWIITFTIAEVSFCGRDLPAFWDVRVISAIEHCPNSLRVFGAEGITCFIMDVMILAVPFFWIWRLHMNRSQKWAVSSVFLVGLFTVGASATRMVAMIEVFKYKWGVEQDVLGLKAVSDTMGTVSVFLFWQYIEHGTGMVVCCLPSIKPLLNDGRVSTFVYALRTLSFRTKSDQSEPREGSSRTNSLPDDEKFPSRITATTTVDQYTVPV